MFCEQEIFPLLQRVFPSVLNNQFRGHRIALYAFYALTALTLWRSQHHLFAHDGGAQSIASIPLDTYAGNAADTVVGIFALWGLSQLIIGLIYLLAAIRYRSLIPLLYVLFTFEYAMRFWIGANKAIETAGTAPGGVINLPFMIAGVVLFALSIWRGKEKF
ncbi:MAG: hypothetical protein VX152_11245 [Pseudomonadota bacterium]|nr:hypothetical protein [Pseudomonadota bacterium]